MSIGHYWFRSSSLGGALTGQVGVRLGISRDRSRLVIGMFMIVFIGGRMGVFRELSTLPAA